ncbi:hypothetical protein SVIOM74S_10336 [Streptomyces violarus]
MDKELANLDKQISEAYTRLASTRQAQAGDSGFVNDAILGPLKSKRTAVIDRIGINIRRVGGQAPDNLAQMAECKGMAADANTNDGEAGGGQNNDGQNNDGQDHDQRSQGQDNGGQDQGGDNGQDQGQGGNGGRAANGPVADDFINIEDVQPNSRNLPNGLAANGDGGSTARSPRTAAPTRTRTATRTT